MNPALVAVLAAACAQPVQAPSVDTLARPPGRFEPISVNAELFALEQRLLECEKILRRAERRKVR